MGRAVTSRRAFRWLALATLLLAVGVGFLVRLIDHADFHTVGDGIWWAIVTLGTVGYGDIVPHGVWGRVVGSAVIIIGVTFIAFLTATVTSMFVSNDQEEAALKVERQRVLDQEETRKSLDELLVRVRAIEEKVDRESRS